MPVQRLRAAGYEPMGWFMNPNIHPLSEYLRRRETAGEAAARMALPIEYEDSWDLQGWLAAQLPHCQEKARCEYCCGERLEAVAKKAVETGFRHFSSSLLYSRYQPHGFIRDKGFELARIYDLEFVYQDFRLDWQAGIDLSREWGLYRQAWCGCIFSEAERYSKKFARVRKN